jgi:hypothetical protein
MTSTERQQLHKAISRAQERAEVREAIAEGTVHGSISRQLGEELIEVQRETIKALKLIIAKLEHLVGRP